MGDRGIHALLVGLLVGQLLLLSSRPEAEGSTLERFLLGTLGPIGRTVDVMWDGTRNLGGAARNRSALAEENAYLHAEIDALHQELARLHGVEEELQRLARLSGYARRPTRGLFVADVVLVDRSSWLRTLVLHTGPSQPERNQPVVTAQGLVGRVIVPSGHYAKVQLITDRASAVSAMILRTRRQGIARGVSERGLALTLIPLQADVAIGDLVVTAGIDGVFPRGIPIGTVVSVESSQGFFHDIRLEPAVDFGLLDQVYVLSLETIPDELQEVWDASAR
ncbi:MAG: rod shape-determining protein MreC [Thermoanaerobaculia bacterium]|nr:rod shape-determining protein MreC [Thermoanaerobaculia bacterium]